MSDGSTKCIACCFLVTCLLLTAVILGATIFLIVDSVKNDQKNCLEMCGEQYKYDYNSTAQCCTTTYYQQCIQKNTCGPLAGLRIACQYIVGISVVICCCILCGCGKEQSGGGGGGTVVRRKRYIHALIQVDE